MDRGRSGQDPRSGSAVKSLTSLWMTVLRVAPQRPMASAPVPVIVLFQMAAPLVLYGADPALADVLRFDGVVVDQRMNPGVFGIVPEIDSISIGSNRFEGVVMDEVLRRLTGNEDGVSQGTTHMLFQMPEDLL